MLLGQAAEITREAARRAAREELAKPEYAVGEPTVIDRVVDWVLRELGELVSRTVRIVPGGVTGTIVLIVLLVGAAVLLRLGLGPLPLRDALTDRRRGARSRTADDYRREAESHAAQGRWRDAVRARFRAVARELEQRGVLDARPGRTAGEIAREAAVAVPAITAAARDAADAFDAAWYGRRAATSADYDVVRRADEEIAGRRLAATAGT